MSHEIIRNADDLTSFIVERCKEHWSKTHRALLLTSLGNEAVNLLEDKLLLKHLGGLKGFVENSVPNVKVVTHSATSGKHGIVPEEAQIPEDTDFLFTSEANKRSMGGRNSRVFYHRGFWKAFKHPLKPGYSRVWSSSTPEAFDDLPMGAVIPEHSFQIPEKFIIGIPGQLSAADVEKINESIDEYIRAHDYDENVFMSDKRQKNQESKVRALPVDGVDIGVALSSLSKTDQARILIPLDIVLEMIGRR